MIIDKPLPSNWKAKRLKYLATYNDEVLPETTDDDREIDYVEISGVSLSAGIEQTERMLFYQTPSRARRKVRVGDILVSTVRTYLKAIATVGDDHGDDLIASTGFCVIRPGEEMDSGYLGWVAKSEPFVGEVVARSVGVSYPAINASDLVDIGIPIPPIEVQRRIANFLDEKTALIDALIDKKRALLERLVEQRQALITRAVTKGLNPDVRMKPSGVEWLGDIPAHWVVRPLKRIKQYLTSGSRDWAAFYADEGDPFLRMTNVTGDGIELNLTDLRYVSLDGEQEGVRTKVRNGDILITITAELGAVAIVRDQFENGAFINQHLALFRCFREILEPDFLVNFLSTDVAREQFVVSGNGGTKQGLGFDQVGGVIAAFPDLIEQRRIARHCFEIRLKFGQIRAPVMGAIDELSEFRSALITSAITGQLPELNG